MVDDEARLSEHMQIVGPTGEADDDGERNGHDQDEQPHKSKDDPQHHGAIVTYYVAKSVDAGGRRTNLWFDGPVCPSGRRAGDLRGDPSPCERDRRQCGCVRCRR